MDLHRVARAGERLRSGREHRGECPRFLEGEAVHGRGEGRQSCVSRVEEDESLVGEEGGQYVGEGSRERGFRAVSPLQQGEEFLRMGFCFQLGAEGGQGGEDARSKVAVGDGRSRRCCIGKLERQATWPSARTWDDTVVNLREVVVLRLEPEDGNTGLASFFLKRARGDDCGCGFVERVQRPQEEAHLLPRHHCHGARLREQREVALPRGTGREARVLRTEDVQ